MSPTSAEVVVAGAFFIVVAFSVLEALGHIAFAGARAARGAPAGWRLTPLFRLGVVALGGYFATTAFNRDLPLAGELSSLVSLLFLLLPASFVVETYARSSFRPYSLTFIATLFSIAALPAAGYVLVPFHDALGHGADGDLAGAVESLEAPQPGGNFDPTDLLAEHFFEVETLSRCAEFFQGVNRGEGAGRSDQYLLFWIDQTARGLLIDIPEVYGCQLSKYTHDPDSIAVATAVASYRVFVSVIGVAIVLAALGFRREDDD